MCFATRPIGLLRKQLIRLAAIAALCACGAGGTHDGHADAAAGQSQSASGGHEMSALSGGGGTSTSAPSGTDSGTPELDAGSTCFSCGLGAPSHLSRYSSSECESVGATVVDDRGDGSVPVDVCPNSMQLLGTIDNNKDSAAGSAIEDALCCLSVPTLKCTPPAANSQCFTLPAVCGARAGQTCRATEFCAYSPGGLCGAADAESSCRRRPSVCSDIDQPVCGCDGKTYANACKANGSGTGINTLGPCPAP